MIFTKDGTVLNKNGNVITSSKGETFFLSGNHTATSGHINNTAIGTLTGKGGVISRNVKNEDEAMGIIIGMHGGKKY